MQAKLMNSSTSNSEAVPEADATGSAPPPSGFARQCRRLAAPALVVVLCFIGMECFTRIVLIPRSLDLERLKTQYPARATELLRQPGIRIAIIGNSASDDGIDAGLVQDTLRKSRLSGVSVRKFPVDDTTVVDWYYIANHYFWRGAGKPDLIIVTFEFNNLLDGRTPQIGRLAHYFTTSEDWKEVFAQDLKSTSQRVDFVLSTEWLSLAMRDRIQHRIMNMLVPQYQEFTQDLRSVLRERDAKNSHPAVPASCHIVERFLRRAHEEETAIWFLAFPARDEKYELNQDAVASIRRAGMQILDMRSVPGIRPDMYQDWIHMTEVGQRLFSVALAERLKPLVAKHPTLNRTPVPTAAVSVGVKGL